jgi:hypothetical protein
MTELKNDNEKMKKQMSEMLQLINQMTNSVKER